MAKLYLRFDSSVLKEFTLAQGVIGIGRLPDNLIHIDNLAVSGHHARIYWDTDHYVIEDNNSLNGTFVNKQRVGRAALKDGDEILIGKHHIDFKDEWHEDAPAASPTQAVDIAPLPKMQETMVLDTRKAKEMMAQARAAAAGGPAAVPAGGEAAPSAAVAPVAAQPAAPPKERVGVLTVMEGKTDESQYTLGSKLTVIGKSEMASVRLKGWFAPKVAAQITRRESRYLVGAADKSVKVKINGQDIAGQHELGEGDILELAGVKFSFTFEE